MNPKKYTTPLNDKKIAIVADWLIDFAGAEVVISHLLELFPHADIYTSVCFMDHPMLQGRTIYTSGIQKIPFLNRKHKLAGMLRPWAFRSFDFSDYDIIVSSSSAESKNAGYLKRGEHTKHFCYCHTPIRYYWSHYQEYLSMMEFGWLNPLAQWILPKVIKKMRKMDYDAAQRVDYFIANSQTTAHRIQQYYDIKGTVIYPGIDPQEFSPTSKKGNYYFGIGRCIPYKKFDLLVDAFNKNGKRLIIATNTDNLLYQELKKKSGKNIEWIFAPSKKQRNDLYAGAKAFLFPPEEDFGLVPVESMMSGTPVIAYGKGGATETIIDKKTGIFFSPQTAHALNDAIEIFETMDWDTDIIRNQGMQFSKEHFQQKMYEYITQNME